MTQIQCARCHDHGPALSEPPFPGLLGEHIARTVCGRCYDDWKRQAVEFVHEQALNLLEPGDRVRLRERFDAFMCPQSAPASLAVQLAAAQPERAAVTGRWRPSLEVPGWAPDVPFGGWRRTGVS